MQQDHGIELVWVGKEILTAYKLPVYFTVDGQMLTWFNDYMMYFAKPAAYRKEANYNTFDARARDLKSFAMYLFKYSIDWKRFNDEYFYEYIEREREIIYAWQEAGKYEQKDPVGANINVNRKIYAIYDFYEWAQHNNLIEDIIGPGLPIDTLLSTAKEAKNMKSDKTPRSRSNKPKKSNRSVMYRPMATTVPLYRTTIKHIPTDSELDLLDKQIAQESDNHYVAERNLLFLAIVRATGLRAGSVTSLSVYQIPTFSQLVQETNTIREYPIQPRIQKRGYQNIFTIDYSLCIEIRKFIDGPRSELLNSLGITNSQSHDAIFLNSNTGSAMSSKALQDVVRNGFRKIGVTERRTGTHSIRRARANHLGMDIIRRKRASGGLLTPEVVVQEIAKSLGQSSLTSQEAYVYSLNALEAETDEAQMAKLRMDLDLRENRIALKEARLLAEERRLQRLGSVISKARQDGNENDELEEF